MGLARVNPEQARFFMALGAVGYVKPAAELAEVELDQAWDWVEGLPRPAWTARRNEAAVRLFAIASTAVDQILRLLTEPPGDTTGQVPLRDLVLIAERFFTAALRLDKDVAGDDDTLRLDLEQWSSPADADPGLAGAASGTGGGDGQ